MVLSLFDAVPLLAFTTIDGPNQKWDGDITYIWTREGWLYRAVILDMHSRRVIALSWFGRVGTNFPQALGAAPVSIQQALMKTSNKGQ